MQRERDILDPTKTSIGVAADAGELAAAVAAAPAPAPASDPKPPPPKANQQKVPPPPSREPPRADTPTAAGASGSQVTPQDNNAALTAGGVEKFIEVVAGIQVFHLGFFKSRKVDEHWHNHNAALKWFREQDDTPAGWASENWRKFSNTENSWRPEINHLPGMEWTMKTERMVRWSWFDMVAQLDEPSMQYVVNGGESRGGGCGVTECWFLPRRNSYDHQLQNANRDVRRPTRESRIWDFVKYRADGTGVRLHPQWSTNKIMTFAEEGHWLQVEPPDHGPGHSDGKGTFKVYKNKSNQKTLKFADLLGTRRR